MERRTRRLFVTGILVVIFYVDVTSGKPPCESKCSSDTYPHCGTWLHSDNIKEASGIYHLQGGFINLTCTFTSLPRLARVTWFYKHDHTAHWTPLKCSGLTTLTDCSFNSIQEHKSTSVCMVQVKNLTQSGLYRCSAGSDPDPVASETGHVHIYGVKNITKPASPTFWYGEPGELSVEVCGNPEPDVVWIHEEEGIVISPHNSRFAILPLRHSAHKLTRGGMKKDKFCYIARLFVSRVEEQDSRFTIIASNSLDSKSTELRSYVFGVPASDGLKTHIPAYSLVIAALLLTVYTQI